MIHSPFVGALAVFIGPFAPPASVTGDPGHDGKHPGRSPAAAPPHATNDPDSGSGAVSCSTPLWSAA